MGDRENTGQQQQEPQKQPPSPLLSTPTSPVPDPKQPGREDIHNEPQPKPEAPEQWFRSPDWWMVIITALLFGVGVVTLIVFYRQFGEMQAQTRILNEQAKQAAQDSIEASKKVERQLQIGERNADVAEQTLRESRITTTQQHKFFEIEQRPFVVISNCCQLFDASVPSQGGAVSSQANQTVPVIGIPLGANVYFKNIGKSPALNMHIHQHLLFGDDVQTFEPIRLILQRKKEEVFLKAETPVS